MSSPRNLGGDCSLPAHKAVWCRGACLPNAGRERIGTLLPAPRTVPMHADLDQDDYASLPGCQRKQKSGRSPHHEQSRQGKQGGSVQRHVASWASQRTRPGSIQASGPLTQKNSDAEFKQEFLNHSAACTRAPTLRLSQLHLSSAQLNINACMPPSGAACDRSQCEPRTRLATAFCEPLRSISSRPRSNHDSIQRADTLLHPGEQAAVLLFDA